MMVAQFPETYTSKPECAAANVGRQVRLDQVVGKYAPENVEIIQADLGCVEDQSGTPI
jgi:hypothetical protein